MAPKWELLMNRLRDAIEDGTYPPGSTLPPMDDLVAQGEGSRTTIHQAYRALEAAGYVVMIQRKGTVVRDRTPVRVPLSRYSRVLAPNGDKGPWETATADQGLNGRVVPVSVATEEAPASVAAALEIPEGSPVVRRSRNALIDNDVVQVQHAWYPLDVAEEAGIAGKGKIVGGIYAALKASGLAPARADEVITARMPSKREAKELIMSASVPVLLVERVTRGRDGRVLELLQIVGAADRLQLVYDDLPIKEKRTRSARSQRDQP